MDVIESNRMPNEKTKEEQAAEFISAAHRAIENATESLTLDLTDMQKQFKRLTKAALLEHSVKQRSTILSQITLIAELQKWDDLNTAKIAEQAQEITRLKGENKLLRLQMYNTG